MTACCEPPCVSCEVDGLPIDPDWWAERQAAEKEAREAAERLLSSIPVYTPGPLSAAALAAPVTSRDRGRTRREAIEEEHSSDRLAGLGITFSDRRQSHGSRGR